MNDVEKNEQLPRILAVDDMPDNLQIIGELLSRHLACDLSFAMDGPQALTAARDLQPDLILLDIMMPGMSGLEVCRQLKTDQRTAGAPVLFLTAKTEAEDIVAGFEAGAADYIVKPFNGAELVARTRTHLDLHRTNAMLARQNRELRAAMEQIKVLRGIVPICSGCKKIRTDAGYWQQVEEYVSQHTEAQFSHGICPECMRRLYPEMCDDSVPPPARQAPGVAGGARDQIRGSGAGPGGNA